MRILTEKICLRKAFNAIRRIVALENDDIDHVAYDHVFGRAPPLKNTANFIGFFLHELPVTDEDRRALAELLEPNNAEELLAGIRALPVVAVRVDSPQARRRLGLINGNGR